MPLQEFPPTVPAQVTLGPTTATTFTQGSVLFAGASGVLSQNNAALFWDNAAQSLTITGSLGVGQAVSGATLVGVLGSEAIASGASAVWDAIKFSASTATLSGSTNITTAGGFNLVSFAQPIISAASALTVTNAATVTILGAPTGSGAGPATITNAYALWVQAGASRFGGQIIGPAGSATAPSFAFSSATNDGMYSRTANIINWTINGTINAEMQNGIFMMNSGGLIGFNSSTVGSGSIDTYWSRGGAGIMELKNSNTAQTFRVYAGNGANLGIVTVNESLTIAAAATTDSSTTIPAGAIILSVGVRVTTVIPTATTFTVTAATGGNTFSTAAVSTAANTTDKGTAAGALYTSAGTKVRITPNSTPGAATGVVRLAITYFVSTPPTS